MRGRERGRGRVVMRGEGGVGEGEMGSEREKKRLGENGERASEIWVDEKGVGREGIGNKVEEMEREGGVAVREEMRMRWIKEGEMGERERGGSWGLGTREREMGEQGDEGRDGE